MTTKRLLRAHASEVWAQLAALSLPIVQAYHSDLYWDAMWLARELPTVTATEPLVFWFAARKCGTSIGTDMNLALYIDHDKAWKVEIRESSHGSDMVNVSIEEIIHAEIQS